MVKRLAALLFLVVGMSVLFGTRYVSAADQQFCKFDGNCVVGEFVFDDNYVPIAIGATCNLTSRDPSGNIFVNSALMPNSGKSDGWYSYPVNVGETEGIYPTQMCCSVPVDVGTTQYMCLDKSFRAGAAQLGTTDVANAVWNTQASGHTTTGSFGNNLQNPTLTAFDFWNYSNRTLSNFGTLVSDIWGYSNKSLTSFGTLVADIWSNSTVNTLATKTDTNNIRSDVAGIGTSLATISGKIDTLNTEVNSIGSTVGTILNKWGSYSVNDILSSVNSVNTGLGNNGDTCGMNSVFGNIACVKDKWGIQTAQSLYNMANNAYGVGTSLISELNYNGKSTTAYDDLQTINNYVNTLQASIGSSSDVAGASTLFGKISGNQGSIMGVQTSLATAVSNIRTDIANLQTVVNSMSTTVGSINTNVNTLITKWGSYSASDIISNVATVQTRLGTNSDNCTNNSIFGNIACVKDKWGTQTADTLYTAANNAYSTATALQNEINYNGKSTNAYDDLQTIKNYVGTLETSIGSSSDLASASTLFGKIKGNNDNITAVSTKVDTINSKVDTLNSEVSGVGTSVSALLTKWGNYTVGDVLNSINGIGNSLGTGSDTCTNNTIFGNIACVKDKWGTQTADALYTAANSAFTTVTSLRSELNYNGKSTTAYADLQSIKNYVDTLETSIGNSGDLASASTLFGKIKGNNDSVASAVTSIKGSSNRDLSFLSGEVEGVQTSVDTIGTKVDALNSGVATLNTNVNTLVSKWGTYTVADVINNVSSLKNSIGVSGDVCSNTTTLFGGIDCLRSNGGNSNSTLVAAVNNVSSLVTELTNELNYNGKSTTAYDDAQAIKTNLGVMLTAMGSNNDDANTATVFGRIKKIQSTVEALNTVGGQAASVIDKWGSLSASDIYDKVKDLSSQISAINVVDNVSSILTVNQASSNDLQTLKNQVMAMEALVNMNKALLEKTTVKPIVKTWLEEGSIIFKTMIDNPSTERQTVPLKFYLPREADKKNIIKMDSGLDVIYDAQEGAYYVSGEFDLKPNETKIVAIEVEDVWKVAQSQIDSLRMQVDQLSTPLKGTAYFAQGVTLKSDITVQLDNIVRTQQEAVTPDSRIKVYRDNSDQLNRIQSEINDLKGLVTSVSSSGSLMGFVGGSQTISLWGVMLVLMVGIALMTIYMRMAIGQLSTKRTKKTHYQFEFKHNLAKMGNVVNNHHVRLAALFIVTTAPTFAGTWVVMNKVMAIKPTKKTVAMVVKTAPVQLPTLIPTLAVGQTSEEAVLGVSMEKIKVAVPDGSTSIKIRILPDAESTILARLWKSRTVDKYSEKDEWDEIGTTININGKDQYVRGWIRKVCEASK